MAKYNYSKNGRSVRTSIKKQELFSKIREAVIEAGGDFNITKLAEENNADRKTVRKYINHIYETVPEEILLQQKTETARELLFTDGVIKALLNKIKVSNGELSVTLDEATCILDLFRRHKEGKIKIAEAYGLKEKVADKIEAKVEGEVGWWRQKVSEAKS